MFEDWCQEAARRLHVGHVLQLAGGFRDEEKTVSVSQGRINYIEELTSDHEKADSRMFVHLKYAYKGVIIFLAHGGGLVETGGDRVK